jgi:phospholipid/cholesterol/gamma-HCH transport system substrate-binding protein
MPRTRSLAWSELKIGVLTIVAIVIAAITIFLLTGQKGFAWQRYSLKAQFGNVAGLNPGSPVRVAGVEVGSVDGVELAGDKVDVTFEVNKRYRDRITTTSSATLGSVSLLGEASVDISPSTTGTPIPDFGYVPTGKAAPQLADVTTQASEGIQELSGLIRDVRQGRGTVGKLMTDDQLYVELQRFVGSASDVTRAIRDGKGSIGRLVNDPAVATSLQAAVGNLEQMTRQINAGQGSLGRLLKDDAFANSLNGATANLETLTARLNRGEGTAGKLMTDATLFNRLNSVSSRVDDLLLRLNDGQGTVGQLLKDRQLYENMNKVTTELSSLVAEIKKNPKKYLNVKMSIF